ncbi:MAG: hypothetical protein NVSMB68_02140 [Thermoanaerobaculia bacterium]
MPPQRILVVDDDPSILRLVATILRREQYDVDTANGGREALSKIELSVYDAIVLDLMMPDVSGLDVLEALYARAPRVRCVIILSAGSSVEINDSINPIVFGALRKPFNNAELISTVTRCIESHGGPLRPAVGVVLPVKRVA